MNVDLKHGDVAVVRFDNPDAKVNKSSSLEHIYTCSSVVNLLDDDFLELVEVFTCISLNFSFMFIFILSLV